MRIIKLMYGDQETVSKRVELTYLKTTLDSFFKEPQLSSPDEIKAHIESERLQINKDMNRARFLGDEKTIESLKKAWLDAPEQDHRYAFLQGDDSGSSTINVLYSELVASPLCEDPLFLENHSYEEAFSSMCRPEIRFAYKNDLGQVSSVCIAFNRFDPSQWIVGILHSADLPFRDRRLFLYFHEIDLRNTPQVYASSRNYLETSFRSEEVACLFRPLFTKERGSINTDCYEAITGFFTTNKSGTLEEITSACAEHYPNTNRIESNDRRYRLYNFSQNESTSKANDKDDKSPTNPQEVSNHKNSNLAPRNNIIDITNSSLKH